MLFIKLFLSPFLFRYKFGTILDFRIWILELRNSVYYKIDPPEADLKSKISNLKSQTMTNDFASLMPSLSLTLNVEP
jgi:hypothetical protein